MPPRKKLRLGHSSDQYGSASVDVAALAARQDADATSSNTSSMTTPRRKSSRSTAGQRSGVPSVPPAAAALRHQDPTPLLPDSASQTQDTDESDSITTSSKTGILSLPPELRLMIYDFALDQKMDQRIRAISFPIWRNYNRCKTTLVTLQMSLANLANTCKLVEREVRDFRANLEPKNRFAAIEYSSKNSPGVDGLHIGYLQRASCPIADMTDLEIIFNFTLREDPNGEPLAPEYISNTRLALDVMLDYQHFAKFLKDATNLRSLKIFLSVEEALTSEENKELLRWLVYAVGRSTTYMTARHQRVPFIPTNARVLRNLDFMECSVKYR